MLTAKQYAKQAGGRYTSKQNIWFVIWNPFSYKVLLPIAEIFSPYSSGLRFWRFEESKW